jgi:Undecaprenyl-phosphate glucose phosphotransferase
VDFFKKYNHHFQIFFVLFDAFVLVTGYIAARYYSFAPETFYQITPKEIITFSILMTIFFLFLERTEYPQKFRLRSKRKIISTMIMYGYLSMSSLALCQMVGLFAYSKEFCWIFAAATFFVFMFERMILKMLFDSLRKHGVNNKKYLLIGAGLSGFDFYKMIVASPTLGIKIDAVLDDGDLNDEIEASAEYEKFSEKIIGSTTDIKNILEKREFDNVIITLPMSQKNKITDITNICEKRGIHVELVPNYYQIVSHRPSVREINGVPLIGIRNVPLEGMFNRMFKRIFDIVFSFLAIIILSPVLLVVALAVKLSSPGPVLFVQKRTGLKNREFNIYKFRTMVVNNMADTLQSNENDPRKTKLGDFLRRTNLDELPQLFNIFRGEMSFVGPRPHMIKHTEEFYQKYDKYMVRHWVKPGLTGWAQVNGWRGDSDIEMRVKFDIEYIENWTFFWDIKIIFLTIFGKKARNHAY